MKNDWLLIVVAILAISFAIFSGIMYTKNDELNKQNVLLNDEKQLAISEREQCYSEKAGLQSQYDLLQTDVAKIYKTCMTDNACKGRYPNVSWLCNNVGDAVSDPSHTCECDNACQLTAVELKKA